MTAIGKKSKNGIIIKSTKGFDYYHGRNESHGLRPVLTDPVGTRSRRLTVKTMKVFHPVSIANNQISVTIYPDGRIDIKPSI
jgi:hypothetical protein